MAQSTANIDRIEAARRLYIKYEGKQHELIEQEMRDLGYTDFNRRILYPRFERKKYRPGWPERFGFVAEAAKGSGGVEEKRSGGERSSSENGSSSFTPSLSNSLTPVLPASDFDHFQAWLAEVSPGMTWTWKHQVHIYKKLKLVSDGQCNRLMIFLPPRHGKSELVTVRYTAWRMKQKPEMNVILGSYNQRLANRFSRKIRKVLMDDHFLTAETQRRGEDEGTHSSTFNHKCNHTCNAGPATEAIQINGKTEGCRPCTCKENASPRLGVSAVDPNASLFPFIRNTPKNTESEWETAVGGGLRAVGVGAGVTGFGANLIVIDDPVKSRAEAESAKMREKVWHWFNDDIYTRLEPGGSIVLIQTRWHEDDLAGRLLRESEQEGAKKWEVVNLPALAEASAAVLSEPPALAGGPEAASKARHDQRETDAKTSISTDVDSALAPMPPAYAGGSDKDEIGRKLGEALCPERYDIEELKQLQQKLGSYSFAALYQQRPVPAEGGMFKRKWFENNIISAAPPNLRWKRGTDPGVSAGEKADYSASVRVAIDKEGNMYIADMFRRQVEYPDLKRFILERLQQERNTEHAIELACHGNAIHQDVLIRPLDPGTRFSRRSH